MNISDEGLRLIKSFEGYHRKQPDGSCVAYRCPAGVPTIGWGCTEGVYMGLHWTAGEAEAGLRREIAKFEAAVIKYVTVEINQNEFDALVSLAYNIGGSALARSSVLKRLNSGDREGAAKAFEMWVRGGGKVLPGLVTRRKREAALFLKPVEAPEEPFMPQKVDEAKPVPVKTIVATSGSALGATAATIADSGLPAPPDVLNNSVSAVTSWKALVTTILVDPLMLAGVALVASVFLVPWAYDKWSKS